jgi:RecJ-like exonuclease
MRGIVSAIRHSISGEELYTIIGENPAVGSSDRVLKLYDAVEFNLDGHSREGHARIVVDSIEEGDKSAYSKEIERLVGENLSKELLKTNIKQFDSVIESMQEGMLAAEKRIIRSALSGSPIVVRFHNDGDGSSGAIALFRSLSKLQDTMQGKSVNISYRINKSIAYYASSLWNDKLFFNSFESAERPLVVIVDFGTSEQSIEAIEGADGIDLVWVDHHPIPKEFPLGKISIYISPWLHGGGSDQTAGAIACVLAYSLTKQSAKEVQGLQELAYISMISDHSAFAPKVQEAAEKALVLDHITSKKLRYEDVNEPSLTPKSMNAVLENPQKWKEVFKKAHEQLDEALRLGMKHAKHYKSALGFKIVELDFGHVSVLDYDILPGRYSSRLHDEVHELLNEDVVLIVHYANSISIRMDKKVSKSINILSIIDNMKANKDYVLNGGGHMEAASIKVADGYIDEALDALFTELGADRNA